MDGIGLLLEIPNLWYSVFLVKVEIPVGIAKLTELESTFHKIPS